MSFKVKEISMIIVRRTHLGRSIERRSSYSTVLLIRNTKRVNSSWENRYLKVLNNAIIMYHYFRFQKACVKYGVPDVDLFQAVDLIERKNIAQVTNTIFAIGRTVIILKHIFHYSIQMYTIGENNNKTI